MTALEEAFRPLLGQYCWGGQHSPGSFLTYEFGAPRLHVVREPRQPRAATSPSLQRRVARRIVTVRGDWRLWIYCCNWHFSWGGQPRGSSDSPQEMIREIVWDLNGQALTRFEAHPSGCSVFEFDLGGRLETSPNTVDYETGVETEQWLLYDPSGHVLVFRADGRYTYERADSREVRQWTDLTTPVIVE